tara:strand:+ start:13170 stop:13469 length:300 start_codon:yes stop_codon:yes gene_type:complete
MKPTKSKLLLLDKNSKWWLNGKGKEEVSFAFMSNDDWYIIKSKPIEKLTEKPTDFSNTTKRHSKKLRSKIDWQYVAMLTLSSALGISLAFNLLAYLFLN